MRARHEKYLLELTGLVTASGREDRVVSWVKAWAKRRRSVRVQSDCYGNLMLKRVGARSRRPIILTAHMDHPAFVVVDQPEPGRVVAAFRGGVEDRYFVDSHVRLHSDTGLSRRGRVIELSKRGGPGEPREAGGDKRVRIEFARFVAAKAGDVLTWDLPAPKIVKDRLRAPACDDLAGLAAALSAFEILLKTKPKPGKPGKSRNTGQSRNPGRSRNPGVGSADVRVLLTRAEEVGFIGAIGACKSGIIPKAARLLALENSKSYEDSPIGGGPIVRVGDHTSSFDPDLTYRVAQVAQRIHKRDPGFNWQRKLMPGGTCEASAYQAFGYTATCLCLPLGNYHNMHEPAKGQSGRPRIDSEVISLADYHGLVRLLIEIGRSLDLRDLSPSLKDRLGPLFARRRGLLA